jgi:hypothetical protein
LIAALKHEVFGGLQVTVTFSDIDGTLVHYPTSQPGEPYEDEHGCITQESVRPGFSLYADKVLYMQ